MSASLDSTATPTDDTPPANLNDWDLNWWMRVIHVKASDIVNQTEDTPFFDFDRALTTGTFNHWRKTGYIAKGKGVSNRSWVLAVLTTLIKAAIINNASVLNGTPEQIREHAQAFVISKATEEQANPLTAEEWDKLDQVIRPLLESKKVIPAPSDLEKRKHARLELIADDDIVHVVPEPVPVPFPTLAPSPNRLHVWLSGAIVLLILIVGVLVIGNRNVQPIIAAVAATTVPIVPPANLVSISATAIGQNLRWTEKHQTIGGLLMDYVPAGCFAMGSQYGKDNVKPVTQVCFDKGFWIGKTKVTIGQFGTSPDAACNTDHVTPIDPQTNQPNYITGPALDNPMNCITWAESNAYCQNIGLRLPTEAEWEYAARGPDSWLYPWGNSFDPTRVVMRLGVKMPGKMQPVGSYPNNASWVGALDMLGELREFTSTIYDDKDGKIIYAYPYHISDGREALANSGNFHDKTATTRVTRGGSFDDLQGSHDATFRDSEWYDFRYNIYGFRCASDDNTPKQPN